MLLREHGLCEHFISPECFDDPDYIQLIPKLLLGLLE